MRVLSLPVSVSVDTGDQCGTVGESSSVGTDEEVQDIARVCRCLVEQASERARTGMSSEDASAEEGKKTRAHASLQSGHLRQGLLEGTVNWI